MNHAYLSLGSNLDKEHNMRACIDLLAQHGRLLAISALYETAPIGNPTDPAFLNAAVLLETPLGAADLKALVLRPLEDQLGRRRSADPNAPRPIDVDISLFNDAVFDLGKRHIPDPEILLYPHIIVPLADIAPTYRHPETGETLAEIARRVTVAHDQSLVRRDDIFLESPVDQTPRRLLPLTAARDGAGRLCVGGCALPDLAAAFGTPLYLYDVATLDAMAITYQEALATAYPAHWEVAYAAKAWLCTATAQWAAARGLGLDVVSAGELAIARHGGFPAERIHFHGNNKTPAELAAALAAGVGRIVVDHAAELALVDALARTQGMRQPIWLRINPDVDVDTHGHTRTGHAGSKFGLALADGTALAVAEQALRFEGVELRGLHCHIGSQFRDAGQLVTAMQRLLDLAAQLYDDVGWQVAELSPGGGWAVPYVHDQAAGLPSVAAYVTTVAEAMKAGCQQRGLPLPKLVLEPGRSLVARAGVALYTVGAVKQAGAVTYAFIDGGLADNPRPALYDARYTAVLANRLSAEPIQRVHVAGPYCETGDVLIQDSDLPPLQPGDLLAVPASGAYQLSMASNYNAALRPAVVWVENGQARLVQRRESVADLLARDVIV